MNHNDSELREPHSTGIILAGGRSTRLGHDKASALLDGRPLLQHVVDRLQDVVDGLIIVCRRDQVLPAFETALHVEVMVDTYEAMGPVGGLFTGLSASRSPRSIAVACDMPLLRPALLEELLRLAPGYDAVVPLKDGQLQPLCAVYAQSCVPVLRERIEAGQLRLTDFVEAIRTRVVPQEEWSRFDPAGLSFENLNREADFERAAALLRRQRR